MAEPERRSLSIVLPCFDEAASIEAVVRRAVELGRRACDPGPEEGRERLAWAGVVVVNDGSTDDTSAILARLGAEIEDLVVVEHATNRGYGAALRSGFARARGDLVFYTDADGQFDLAELPRLLALLDRFDVVTGYRVARRDGPLRALYGAAWTALTDLLLGTGVRDVNCAFKVFPRSLVQPDGLRSTGGLLGAELMSEARRRGLRIGEIGVRHLPRRAGRPTGAYPSVVRRAFRELVELVEERAAAARAARPATPPGALVDDRVPSVAP